jgi:cyclophilin family peptidyl-prolyl cis-trans isomerase
MKQLLFLACVIVALASTGSALCADEPAENPRVLVKTSLGEIVVELDPQKAPVSVANFLEYVDEGFYDGTVFHRVIPGFMIQGGGFTADLQEKETRPPIKNEATNGLKNTVGTIALARTTLVNSATAQFFFNAADNVRLDHRSPNQSKYGYAVFGRIVAGLNIVNRIESVPTGSVGRMHSVPNDPVLIVSVTRVSD